MSKVVQLNKMDGPSAKRRRVEKVMKVEFELVKPARGSGGDRYVAEVDGEEWTVYFKQSISRPDGDIRETITIEIHQD